MTANQNLPEIKGVILKQHKKPMDTTDQRIIDEVIKYMDNNRDVHPYKWVMFASTASEVASDYGRTVRCLLEILTLAIPLKPDMVLQSFKAREFDAKYLHTATSLLEQAEAELASPEDVKQIQMESAAIDLPGPTFLPAEDESEERTYQLTASQIDDLVSGKLALINGELAETDVESFGQGLNAMVFDSGYTPTEAEVSAVIFSVEQMNVASAMLNDLVADANIARLYNNTESVEEHTFVPLAMSAAESAYKEFLSEVKRLGVDVNLLDVALYLQDCYWGSLRGRVIDSLRLMLIMNRETELYLALEKEFWVKPYAVLAKGKRV